MRQVATTAVLLGSLLLGTAQAPQPGEPDQLVAPLTRQQLIDLDKFDEVETCTFEEFVNFYNKLPELTSDFYTDTAHFHHRNDETVTNDRGVDERWKIYTYAKDGISSDRVVWVPHSYVGDVMTTRPVGFFVEWRFGAIAYHRSGAPKRTSCDD